MVRREPLAPPILPAFSAPEIEDLPESCVYDFFDMFGPPAGRQTPSTGQPELTAWVAKHLPGMDRTAKLPDLHRRLMEIARSLGVLV